MRMKSSPKLRPNGWDGLAAAVVLVLAVACAALVWTGGGQSGPLTAVVSADGETVDQVVLADGMTMEEGAITEWGSAGQPYLLLYWEDSGEETTWEPVCVTHTDTIVQDYGTPEMLEEYGDAYTAAAMELFLQSRDGNILPIFKIFYRISYLVDQLQTEPVRGGVLRHPIMVTGFSTDIHAVSQRI